MANRQNLNLFVSRKGVNNAVLAHNEFTDGFNIEFGNDAS